jgi:prepilin-type N-terminal cleavage/methylation domain-containing protein/prepilin-type processing-associated H-X9-DG protein
MAIRKRKGFTLVELLVVISIIGMLMALLLPAVQAAREAGRKASCQNNIYNIAKAMQNYETTKKTFPGYANKVAYDKSSTTGYRVTSYVVPLFPQMERNDLYAAWTDKTEYAPIDGRLFVTLDWGTCPSDPADVATGTPLAYVVNAGEQWSAESASVPPAEYQEKTSYRTASGVFKDQLKAKEKLGMDYLTSKDGASMTLLLSENIQAVNWTIGVEQDPNGDWKANSSATDDDKRLEAKRTTTFIWWAVEAKSPPSTYPPDPDANVINGDKYADPDLPDTDFKKSMKHARPSSYHNAGVNVAFCDGSARFLSDEIDYRTYIQLMTPNDRGVYKTLPDGTLEYSRAYIGKAPLDESKF